MYLFTNVVFVRFAVVIHEFGKLARSIFRNLLQKLWVLLFIIQNGLLKINHQDLVITASDIEMCWMWTFTAHYCEYSVCAS